MNDRTNGARSQDERKSKLAPHITKQMPISLTASFIFAGLAFFYFTMVYAQINGGAFSSRTPVLVRLVYDMAFFGFIPAFLVLLHIIQKLARLKHSKIHPRFWLLIGVIALVSTHTVIMRWAGQS
ncbi:MAG: hypothetical protein AAGI03_08270 [Pseudomonadota bacterium]